MFRGRIAVDNLSIEDIQDGSRKRNGDGNKGEEEEEWEGGKEWRRS